MIAHSHHQPNGHCTCPVFSRTSFIKYLGIIINDTLSFHEHVLMFSVSLGPKPMYVYGNLRHVRDPSIIGMVYLTLRQSILTYCITTSGGAASLSLLPLQRLHRLISKVSHILPQLYPTAELYQYSKVVSVRQLFILRIILFPIIPNLHLILNTTTKEGNARSALQ